jgi:hypothetical protein
MTTLEAVQLAIAISLAVYVTASLAYNIRMSVNRDKQPSDTDIARAMQYCDYSNWIAHNLEAGPEYFDKRQLVIDKRAYVLAQLNASLGEEAATRLIIKVSKQSGKWGKK